MNAGAAIAKNEFLLFLHADSELEENDTFLANALQEIVSVEKEVGHYCVAGHFRLHFKRSQKGSEFTFRYMEGKTALNRVNTTNGDQGFLLRQAFFNDLGGFDTSMHFLEDQKLAEAIRIQAIWITVPGILSTSARRFEKEGVQRRYILMSIIMGVYSTETTAFFRRVQGLYRTQEDTEKLLLWPFFVVIWQMMWHDLGFKKSMKTWFFVGRYIRENSWQFFYLLDSILGTINKKKNSFFLRLYDRYLVRLVSFSIVDVCFAVLAFIWFMCILGPLFLILDGPERE